ncbi:MAG: hypothetical protein D8M52_07630 [Chlorobi bacterium]|nr:MAG: hypothetical protein F9K28_07225 [Bacteroidota bacterium]MBL1161572.1 hypothetical protein [Chlorobiota bacterium]MBW7854155.1 peptidylprolyl isomerase [Candidatus Kapabacteria bacterium]MCC6332256.1 peptidylprolyl isomerase [Ignavibacteria bacterium]MBV6462766.1 Foldase protein PrsA [Chlorobiota bacterium]
MRYIFLSTVLVLASLGTAPLQSQHNKSARSTTSKTQNDLSNQVLATVGAEKVTYAEVQRAFQKNLSRREVPFSSVPRDTALEFLKLYTNYRLKVADALDRGIDKDENVQADIANNRKLLAETWYLDNAFVNKRVAELAQRRLDEIKMSVILCAVHKPNDDRWDTTQSKAKATALIAMLNQGADFAKLARDSSDDKETGAKSGQLPWISGGSIIKAVEDEAYSLKTGAYSVTPVETRFGYFIIKVNDRGPRDIVKFRHILLQVKEGRDSNATNALADSLITILKAKPAQQEKLLKARGLDSKGDVFETLAKTYSDDDASAPRGGYLGAPYSRSAGLESNNSHLIPEFEDAVFALRDGEISTKVHTIYGVHIIRRDSTKHTDAIAETDNAKKTYRRLYFEDDKRQHNDSLKNAWGYHWNTDVFNTLMNTIDTTKNSSDTSWWKKIPDDQLPKTIYSYPAGGLTVKDLTDSMHIRMDMRGYTLNRTGFERAANKITDPILLEQATRNLDKADPEFAALMREFNDGILLFKVEEQEVWSKLKFDTTDARVFFDSTRSRWMTDQRYVVSEIFMLTDSAVNNIQQQLLAGADFTTLARTHTQRQAMRETSGKYPTALSPKTSAIARKVEELGLKVGQISSPFTIDRGTAIIRLDAIEPPRQKTFEEAMSELAPAYQDQLQKKLTNSWLDSVRKRHTVTLNQKAINAIWR